MTRPTNSRLRTAIAGAALLVSTAASVVLLTSFGEIPSAVTVAGLLVNAMLYGAVLYTIARPRRATLAATTAIAATAVPVVLLQVVNDGTLFLIGWPFAYVVAWSAARRVGIGVFGLVTAAIVVILGYALLVVHFMTSAPSSGQLTESVSGAVLIAWLTAAAANGALWLEEAVRERITRRTTSPGPRETAPAFPSS